MSKVQMKLNRQLEIDRRSRPVEFRAEGEGSERHIVGYAAVFNVLSEEMWGFREIIKPGAFDGVIEKSDVRALWNHNPDHVLGRVKAGTLKIETDERGLAVDINPPDTGFARDLMVSLDRGDVDQMSFAFTVGEDRWYESEEGETIREILAIRELYDVSPVTYPAYAETDVSARTQESLKEFRSSVDARGAVGAGDSERARRDRELRLLELENMEV